MASLTEDASALLEALDVPRAHTLGCSLGSAVLQELALAHPEQVASAVMYATWGRSDGYQRSMLTALRLPYTVGSRHVQFNPYLALENHAGQLASKCSTWAE
jgi:pimeloyl-ACP methyl ester carboxylesterase